MVSLRSRVRGHRVSRHRWHSCLHVQSLEGRLAPATLIGTHYPTDTSGPQSGSYFGRAIVSNEYYHVVAASGGQIDGEGYSGVVFVYDASTHQPIVTLKHPNPGSTFGRSVAIAGHKIVVGAPGINVGYPDGVAYVFDITVPTKSTPILVIPNPSPGPDSFGATVAISATRLVVGAPSDEGNGAIHIYDLTAPDPIQTHVTVRQVNLLAANYFGTSLAMDEDTLVVGAPINYGGQPSRTYVYDLRSSSPTIPLWSFASPSMLANDQFGAAVSVKGRYVAVGAWSDDTGFQNSGRAYVFDLLAAVPSTPLVTLNNPTPAAGDGFGSKVAISNNRVLVGTPRDESTTFTPDIGAAYLYDFQGKTPATPVAVLRSPNPEERDKFGTEVCLFQDRAIISCDGDSDEEYDSGAVWIYDVSKSSPTIPVTRLANPTQATRDQMGSSLALSNDVIVAGAPYDDLGARDAGSAYVFDVTDFTAATSIHLKNPVPAKFDQFGAAAAVSGKYVVIGVPRDDNTAPDAGTVLVFDLTLPTTDQLVQTIKSPTPTVGARFGSAVAIAGNLIFANGLALIPGTSTYASVVYIFDLNASNPTLPATTIFEPNGGFSYFGTTIAVSRNTLIVGAPVDSTQQQNSGVVWGFDLASSTPTVPFIRLPNPNPASNAQFGSAVAIVGQRVVVGVPGASSSSPSSGRAFVFDLSSATPDLPTMELFDPTAETSGHFGASVSIDGNYVVVGAPRQNINNAIAGRAFVYDLASVNANMPTTILENPRPYGGFGNAVAIVGTTVAIADSVNSDRNSSQGAVHVYSLVPPKVAQIEIVSGSPQRSMVSALQIDFDIPVNFIGTPSAAFTLINQSTQMPVTLTAQLDATRRTVTLNFVGGSVDGASLADGRYTLTIKANQFAGDGLDGNGDGIAGDDYVLVGSPANGLFRLFGDSDGNGVVSAIDFGAFRLAMSGASRIFDFNNDGIVSASDLNQFRLRYGMTI